MADKSRSGDILFRPSLRSSRLSKKSGRGHYRPWYEKAGLLADLENGHEKRAKEAFSRAVELRSDLSDGWYRLAGLHAQQNEWEEARACLRRATLGDPSLIDKTEMEFDWFSEDDLRSPAV